MSTARLPMKILLLGSGELGRELTISLKRFGCFVVACDSYPNAPAMQLADEFRVFNMTDATRLKEIIDEIHPDLVVPEVEKLAVDVLVDLAASGSPIKIVPNSAAVAATFDRRAIRKLAAEVAKVPTSDYGFADSADKLREVADRVGYPCFVKPTMSSSGHGQSMITSNSEVDQAWRVAQAGARAETNWVIAESKVAFDYEITLLTVRSRGQDGTPKLSFCAPIGHRQVGGDYVESWQPQPMSQAALDNAKQIATAVLETLAAQAGGEEMFGIFGVELFVAGDQVWFSEVSPRPHDTGMVTSITQHQSEFDLHARAILGLPVDTSLANPGASAVVKADTDLDSPNYCGVDQALAIADDVRIFCKPESHPGRRMAVVLARGEVAQARKLASEASSKIQLS